MNSSRELNQRPLGGSGAGAFLPTYHREMLFDRRRVRAFQKAIEYYASPEKTFLEIGPGTGVMIAQAANCYGHVIGIERDPEIFAVACENLQRAGLLGGKVELLQGDALEAELPSADVVMAELMSTLMIHEPQVAVMNRVRDVMGPTASIIPGLVVNALTMAWSKFETQGVAFRSPYTLFTGTATPEILSESRQFFIADFERGSIPDRVSATVEVVSLFDAEVNSLILNSFVQLAPGITFRGSDSLNPPMVVPIEPVRASAGERFRIHIEYCHFSDWDQLFASVEES